MTLSRGFILKGIAGLASVGLAATGIGVLISKPNESTNPPKDIPKEKEDLGLPSKCDDEDVASDGKAKECTLTIEDIKKIKFKDLGDGIDSVNGLDGETIKLKIEHVKNNSDYKNNKKYTFENSTNGSDVVISGKESKTITIDKNTNTYFRVEDGKLTKFRTKFFEERGAKIKEVNDELEKIGIILFNLKVSDFKDNKINFQQKSSTFGEDSLKKIKFKDLDGNAATITFHGAYKNVNVEFFYTSEESKFPKNMKFKFTNNTSKEIKFESLDKTKSFTISSGDSNSLTFKAQDGKLVKHVD